VSDLKKRVAAGLVPGVEGVPVTLKASLVNARALVAEIAGVTQIGVSRDKVGTIIFPEASSANMGPNIKAANNKPPINKNTSKMLISPEMAGGVEGSGAG
jgi:hypothetical protein